MLAVFVARLPKAEQVTKISYNKDDSAGDSGVLKRVQGRMGKERVMSDK